MRTARCTINNQVYAAEDFNQVVGFQTLRNNLVCTGCGFTARYRSPGRDGRNPCFYARPHDDGCRLATPEYEGAQVGTGNVEDEIFTTGQRIVVNFNVGTNATAIEAPPTGGAAENGGRRGGNNGGITPREITYRTMSKLLRTLIESEEFRRSTSIIEIPGRGEYVAANLFMNFTDMTEDHLDTYHGYWGRIADARVSYFSRTLWFNSGDEDDVSVLLDQRYVGETLQQFNIAVLPQVAGAYILVFGEFKRAQQNEKKFIQITDPNYFTLRLPR